MKINIHHDLEIHKYENGIMLTNGGNDDYHSMTKWFDNSFSIYFMDTEQNLIELNNACLESCGYYSRHSTIGNTWKKAFHNQQQIHSLERNNQHVIYSKQQLCINERIQDHHRNEINMLTLKMPWYDAEAKVVGLFGCSLDLTPINIIHFSNDINFIKDRLFKTSDSELMSKYKLTEREIQIVRFLVRGQTMREIAIKLGLSKRTVEYYFDNIKLKMNLDKKSQVIEKLYDDFK